MDKRRVGVWRPLLLGAVVLLSSVACSKGEPVGAVDADFLQMANDICAAARARRPEPPPPLPVKNFDPKHPKPDQLPPIGAHFRRFNDSERVASQLAALGEPAKGAAEWQELVTLARRSATNTTAQITAAEAADAAAFVRLVKEGEDLVAEFRRAGSAAGFDASSACARYYAG